MISQEDNITDYIIQELHRIEKDFNIRIIYAVESGSRAWGFSNSESDYDIRFVYIRPLSEYLGLFDNRDVIDYNDLKDYNYKYPLDFSGWDISKALKLYYKNNPSLKEHLKSEIIYYGDNSFFKNLPEYNVATLMHHYYSMSKHKYNKYIKPYKDGELTSSMVKNYCYCIQQLLCYVLLDSQLCTTEDLPINVYSLIETLKNSNILFNEDLVNAFYDILNYYRCNCNNTLKEDTVSLIDEWINNLLDKVQEEGIKKDKDNLKDISLFNIRFRNILYQHHFYDDDLYDRCSDCINSDGMFLDEYEGADVWCNLGYDYGFEGELYCDDYINEHEVKE